MVNHMIHTNTCIHMYTSDTQVVTKFVCIFYSTSKNIE